MTPINSKVIIKLEEDSNDSDNESKNTSGVTPTTSGGGKVGGKYLRDKAFIRGVKSALQQYIGKNTLEQVRIRIRDNASKGFAVRVKVSGTEDVALDEFLQSDFCKDKNITRVSLMLGDGKNGLSVEINRQNGVRNYKVQNGPSVGITVDWDAKQKENFTEPEKDKEEDSSGSQDSVETTKERRYVEFRLGRNRVKPVDTNCEEKEELEPIKDVRYACKPTGGTEYVSKWLITAVGGV